MTGTLWPESPWVRTEPAAERPGADQSRPADPAKLPRPRHACPPRRPVPYWCWRTGRRAVTLVTGASAARRERTQQEVRVRRVLLLNVTYEPLTTVGLHRAVCLVLGDKAEVLHDDADGRMLH